jgi:hypothetical protein
MSTVRCCLACFPDHLTPDDPDKPLTAALGDANLAWRATHTGLDAWGSDLFCPSPPPLFQLQLLVRGGAVQLMPSLDDVRGAVMRVFDGVIEAGQSVEDLGEKVGAAVLLAITVLTACNMATHCSCGRSWHQPCVLACTGGTSER